MKCYSYIAGITLFAVAVVAEEAKVAPSEAHAQGGPQIQFTETKHDFGRIDPQPLTWTFIFKNTGDKTLEIKDVKPGCGCTVIPDFDKTVEPGKEGKITAKLDASNMKGRFEKGINVTSNDPKTPNVHLAITAEIKVDIEVKPQQTIWLNRLQPDTVTNQTLEIRSSLAEPLVVESVDSSVPWLTASVTETTTNSAKIQVTTKPPIPIGTQKATVTAHTKYEKHKDVVITITSQIEPVISAVPGRLVFYKNKDQKTADDSVLVKRNDGKEFHIKEIKSDSAQIIDTLTTNQPGRSYRLNVKYTPKDGQAPASGKLVILTDDPTYPTLEIPYFFRDVPVKKVP